MDESTLRVWIGSHEELLDGEPLGMWVDLPASEEKLVQVLEEDLGIEKDHGTWDYYIGSQELGGLYEKLRVAEDADVFTLNLIAKMGVTLSEREKDAVALALRHEPLGLLQVLNIMIQTDEIPYFDFDYPGAYEKDAWGDTYKAGRSPEENLGHTLLEKNGLRAKLEAMGILEFFDARRYGREQAKGRTLSKDGYVNDLTWGIDDGYCTLDEAKEIVEERWAAVLEALKASMKEEGLPEERNEDLKREAARQLLRIPALGAEKVCGVPRFTKEPVPPAPAQKIKPTIPAKPTKSC